MSKGAWMTTRLPFATGRRDAEESPRGPRRGQRLTRCVAHAERARPNELSCASHADGATTYDDAGCQATYGEFNMSRTNLEWAHVRVCGHVRATPHMQMHVLLGTPAAHRRASPLPAAPQSSIGSVTRDMWEMRDIRGEFTEYLGYDGTCGTSVPEP